MGEQDTALRALIRQRHLSYEAFCREWDRVAKGTDERLIGHYPGRAQYYRWLRGELTNKRPYPDACRMLEAMFPGWSVEALFSPFTGESPPDLFLFSKTNSGQVRADAEIHKPAGAAGKPALGFGEFNRVVQPAFSPVVIPRDRWSSPDMLRALQEYDFRTIFAVVIDFGYSPEHIAAVTRIPVGLVNDILSGAQSVSSWLLADFIAGGLNTPDSARKALKFAPGRKVITAPVLPVSLENSRTIVPVSALVQESTAEAASITMSAGKEEIDPLAIEQLFEEVRRLSITYNSGTAGVDRLVLERATALRANLQKMTAAYRKPSQSSDLYLMIGLLSGICSYACLDLGYPEDAMTQARACFILGDLIGHDGLRAWACGTRSLVARFQGRYDEALSYAREGIRYATTGTSLVRLRCGEGQTLAHIGDATNAIHSLDQAKEDREHVSSPDVVNGLFTFSVAKQTYYSGSSLQWLPGEKNAQTAEAESMHAIQMFRDAGPEVKSLADELLAHCYLSNSRLTLGEIEGSMEALRPVLDLPLSERNSWQRKRMGQIALRLGRGHFSDSRLAISAREEISSFIESSELDQ